MSASFRADWASRRTPLPHFWEHTVGSDHAPMALRADWRAQLERVRAELGMRHVRFHGLLSDALWTLTCQQDKPLRSYFNLDSIFDYLLQIDVRPFVELSFMPLILASGSETVFSYRGNITPPKDLSQWAALITDLVTHLVERYGKIEVRKWFFEVWNEPNLKAFWTGTQAEYFELYAATARAIKAVDGKLSVGGPASADNEWISDMLTYCERNDVPLDFVSTHHYPTDAFGNPGDDTETQLADSHRSVLREEAIQARSEAKGKPLYYTEWNSSSNPRDSMHDDPYAAAFVVKTVLEAQGLVDGYSFWTFSDLFEENYLPSIPFHGGFGLLNLHGIAKPSYRAFQILHGLGTKSIPVVGTHRTVDAWLVAGDGTCTVVMTNFALPRHRIEAEQVRFELDGMLAPRAVRMQRIDDKHANAKATWTALGAPTYPTAKQLAKLTKASELRSQKMSFSYSKRKLSFEVALPPQSVVAVEIELSKRARR